MTTTRRSLLGLLASLPFLRWVRPKPVDDGFVRDEASFLPHEDPVFASDAIHFNGDGSWVRVADDGCGTVVRLNSDGTTRVLKDGCEVAVWSRALTDEEIRELVRAGPGITYPFPDDPA